MIDIHYILDNDGHNKQKISFLVLPKIWKEFGRNFLLSFQKFLPEGIFLPLLPKFWYSGNPDHTGLRGQGRGRSRPALSGAI